MVAVADEEPANSRGDETVLLVEDDDTVRELAVEILSLNGYHVLQAANGLDAIELFAERAEEIAAANDVSVSFEQYYESPAAITDERVKQLVQEAADSLGLETLHMPSGAGHDAQSLKDIAPLGMIFVPSRDGISHAPAEFTSAARITDGANVLLHTIVDLDRAFD